MTSQNTTSNRSSASTQFLKALFQHLTPDRHGVVRDAAIKVLGAALGCIGGAVADWFLPTKAMRR
jgi:hypothetical protein